jgi:hypothetical protein
VTTGLPAVGTFYYALAQIWSWPNAEAVLGSVAAVNTLLGLLLGLSTLSYEKSDAKYDGVLNVGQNEDGVMSITGNVNGEDPSVIANMKSIMFKVNNPNA